MKLATPVSIVEETFKQASDVLGYDLWQLVQHGPAEELNKTWQTQPALLQLLSIEHGNNNILNLNQQ